MKQIYSALIATLFVTSVFAQGEEEWTVPEENVGMITKITATWCGPCGGWGWEAMEGLIESHGEDNIVVSLYTPTSSKLNNPAAVDLGEEIGYGGTPNFAGNGLDQGTTSAAAAAIADSFASAPVMAVPAYALDWVLKDTIAIEVRTKFFEPMDGAFHLKVFMVEDHVMEEQNGHTGDVPHHEVVRNFFTSFTDSTTLIFNGSAEKNKEIVRKYYIEVDPEWDWEELTIVTTLWIENPEDPTDLLYVNGSKEWQAGELVVGYGTDAPIIYPPGDWTVGVEEAEELTFDVYPNPAKDIMTVRLSESNDFRVTMIDLLGKQVYNEQFNSVSKSDIDVSDLPEGVYMLQVKTDTETFTDRIVIK